MNRVRSCSKTLAVVAAVAGATVSILTSGCYATIDSQVVKNEPPRPAPGAKSTTVAERKEGAEITTTISDSTVDAHVEQKTECRNTTTASPALQDIHTTRKLKDNSFSGPQPLNLTWAAIFGGVGGYMAFIAPNNDNYSSTEKSNYRTGGYITMGLAAIPLAFFVINAVRAQDGATTVPAASAVSSSSWTTCGTRALENQQLTLRMGGKTLSASTGSDGRAKFDLGGVQPNGSILDNPTAVVAVPDGAAATVDLTKLQVWPQWKVNPVAVAEAAQEAERRQRSKPSSEPTWRASRADCILGCRNECGQRFNATQETNRMLRGREGALEREERAQGGAVECLDRCVAFHSCSEAP